MPPEFASLGGSKCSHSSCNLTSQVDDEKSHFLYYRMVHLLCISPSFLTAHSRNRFIGRYTNSGEKASFETVFVPENGFLPHANSLNLLACRVAPFRKRGNN